MPREGFRVCGEWKGNAIVIILGDFNAKVQVPQDGEDDVVGRYTFHKKDDRIETSSGYFVGLTWHYINV